jgi:hypothetical protein
MPTKGAKFGFRAAVNSRYCNRGLDPKLGGTGEPMLFGPMTTTVD